MQLAISPDQIGQHPGVTRIRLGARHPVPVAIAVHRHRVHRHHRITSGQQCPYQQPSVGLDPDHDLHRRLGIIPPQVDQLMQPCHPGDPLRHPTLGHHPTPGVHHADVVTVLGPINPHNQLHPSLLTHLGVPTSRRNPAS
jgi:hypothetical protein